MTPTPRFGLGFRTQHFAELRANPRCVGLLEVLSDSFVGVGGPRRAMLEALRADHALALHGVGLGIANDAPPSAAYVSALRQLVDCVEPAFVSDHLCWTGVGGRNSHDLLPIAATREVLALVSERVARVQDALGRRILLENASAYVKFRSDEMTEAELLAALCERTGCGVLLDINNLVVNAKNLGSDPQAALLALDARHVGYLHIAGHTALRDVCVDTHAAPVPGEVWRLFEHAVRRFPGADVVLERDDEIPTLAELVAELELARDRWRVALATTPSEVTRQPTDLASQPGPESEPWCETQSVFWASLGDGDAARARIACALDANAPVAPQRGLRVYRDALRELPERALATNFPALARLLSRRDFSALCAAFGRAHPSTAHDFVRFGAALARFVAAFEFVDCDAAARAACVDIARLEQAQLEVQEAPDVEGCVRLSELAALDESSWESARFSFTPALRVVACEHAALATMREGASGTLRKLPPRARTAVLVTRQGERVHSEEIDPEAALALRALAAGATFAEACAGAGGEQAAARVAQALAIACARGAVRSIVTSREPSQATLA